MSAKQPQKMSEAEEKKVVEELKRLLREGRRSHGKRDLEEAKKLFSKGRELAQDKGWKEDAAVFEASILIADKKHKEVAELLEPLLEKETFHLKGHAYGRIGFALDKLERYDQAIGYYQEALKDPGYDTPGKAWNSMGAAYYHKGDYDKAIECYNKALKTPGYDTPGYTWNNMGLAYGNKGDYDKAIECCKEALDTTNNDIYGDAWHNMGVAYYHKGDYGKAIECYRKALDSSDYDTPGYAWFNMGNAYRNKGELDETLKWFKKARGWYKKNEPEEVERIDFWITRIKDELAAKEKREKLREDAPANDPIKRIIPILTENENRVKKYLKEEGSKEKDILAVLKGWSSSIPVISSADNESFSGQECRGGGYFIKASGEGIVVDPGLDFIDNFGEEKFHIKEIKCVVVSHYHIDHYADLGRIADLEYQYSKQAGGFQGIVYHLDKKTYDNYHATIEERDISKGRLSRRGEDNVVVVQIPPNQATHEVGRTILDLFPTVHPISYSLGFVLNLNLSNGKKIKVGYTSDTAFYPGLCEKFKGCKIIVAHFSSATVKDFAREEFHTRHLGYNGLFELIRQTKARLYIISEFWGGVGDYRIELVQKLTYDLEKDGSRTRMPIIIPGDVGCVIKLNEPNIRCTGCDNWVPYSKIKVTRPDVPFGKLRYLCKNCLL